MFTKNKIGNSADKLIQIIGLDLLKDRVKINYSNTQDKSASTEHLKLSEDMMKTLAGLSNISGMANGQSINSASGLIVDRQEDRETIVNNSVESADIAEINREEHLSQIAKSETIDMGAIDHISNHRRRKLHKASYRCYCGKKHY